MERAVLNRITQNDLVTFGELALPWTWDGHHMVKVYTMELPWRENQSNISCIPSGLYPLSPVFSNTFGHILHVRDVPSRSLIRVHSGNKTRHTHGCVLTGMEIGTVKDEPFIFRSRDALSLVVNAVTDLYNNGMECELEVNDVLSDI